MKRSNTLKTEEPKQEEKNLESTKTSEKKPMERKQSVRTQTKNQQESNRISSLLKLDSKSNVGEIISKWAPVITFVQSIVNLVAPLCLSIYKLALKVHEIIPFDLLIGLFGLVLTFFGGIYVLTLAACEVFYLTGWETTKNSFLYLKDEFEFLWIQSREDDKKDDDKDGIADVLQITPGQLFSRKVAFFFSTTKDPQHVIDMTGAICSSIFGVIAVLKVQFAMTIALGAMIGENLRKPVAYMIVPALSKVIPEKYHQWISPAINVVCKSIAITLAWFIQRIISSVQSAIRGGLLFARNTLGYLSKQGYINFKEDESYLDEAIGWSIAACGIYFQISFFFSVPFPLNIFLFPVTFAENYLQWIVSK